MASNASPDPEQDDNQLFVQQDPAPTPASVPTAASAAAPVQQVASAAAPQETVPGVAERSGSRRSSRQKQQREQQQRARSASPRRETTQYRVRGKWRLLTNDQQNNINIRQMNLVVLAGIWTPMGTPLNLTKI